MRACSALLIVLALAASAARAEESDLDVARAHFVTGKSYFGQQRYEDALKEFDEAFRLSRRAAFLYNIGVCHEQLGHAEQAIRAYQRYLAEEPHAADRASVEEHVARLRAQSAAPVMVAVAPAPPPEHRPVWRRGWFWGVVGGAAVVVVAGVTVGVVVGTRGPSIARLPDLTLGPP